MRALTLTLALVTCATLSAHAQDTISLYGDRNFGAGLSRFITTGAEPFDIVVLAQTNVASGRIEFVMTELSALFPGVFKIHTIKVNDALDLGNNAVGEYYMQYHPRCAGPGAVEVVRVSYLDVGAFITEDVVLSLRGLRSGDSYPPALPGAISYEACPLGQHLMLTPEPWSEYSMPDNEDLAGAVVLNPSWFPVEADARSLSTLKAGY